jgi:hypothetical protein
LIKSIQPRAALGVIANVTEAIDLMLAIQDRSGAGCDRGISLRREDASVHRDDENFDAVLSELFRDSVGHKLTQFSCDAYRMAFISAFESSKSLSYVPFGGGFL